MTLSKKQLDKLFEIAKHNKVKFPVNVTLIIAGETILTTLYANGKHKIHKGEREVESAT